MCMEDRIRLLDRVSDNLVDIHTEVEMLLVELTEAGLGASAVFFRCLAVLAALKGVVREEVSV